jgi:phosphoglycolate phosphatase-like HAD superfamily hydrolase
MVAAFSQLYRHERAFEGFSFAGMTDRAIVRQGLATILATVAEADIDHALDVYLTHLENELGRSEGYRVLPGVTKLLALLRDRVDTAIGLGTGNVRRGAYAKLARGGLDSAFAFGGFGCDAEDRTELLRAGARRGAERLGTTIEQCRVVIIGDTPKDVAAALGLGARCVGVGTGGFAPAELTRLGAHRAFATLDDDGVLEALFDEG